MHGFTDTKDKAASNTNKVENIGDNSSNTGKCHLFNSKRKFLSFNDESSDFKFSVEGKYADLDESKLEIINHDSLINIHNQLSTANQLFQKVLMLEDPLSAQRYEKAKFINITLEPSDKVFGTAYDEVVTNNELGLSNCFIGIKMSDKVNADHNVTPSHELLEIMDSSYGASKSWTRLFRLVDQNDEFSIPNYLDTITYLNNELVLQDNKAYGVTFVKVLFDELSKESDYVSEIKGWDRYAWK